MSGLVRSSEHLPHFWQHIFAKLWSNLEILTMLKILQTWNSSVALLSPTCLVYFFEYLTISNCVLQYDLLMECQFLETPKNNVLDIFDKIFSKKSQPHLKPF